MKVLCRVFPVLLISISMRVLSLYNTYRLLKSKCSNCIDTHLFQESSTSNSNIWNEKLSKVRSNIIGYALILTVPFSQCIPFASNAAYLSEMNQVSDKSQTTVEVAKSPRKSPRPHLYSVEYTDPPSLLPRTTAGESSAVDKLLTSDVILFGKHYLDQTDTKLEIDIMSRMLSKIGSNKLELVIGLPSFPNTESCRKALNSYTIAPSSVETSGASADLMTGLKAAQVNDADVADSLSVLQFARKNRLMVVPLGLAPAADSSEAISDTEGFVASTRGAGFSRYVDLVVKEDYKAVFEAAPDNSKLSFDDYVGLRLLTEEASASAAANFLNKANKPTIMAVLDDQRGVRFGYGSQERLIRNINKQRNVILSETIAATVSPPSSSSSSSSAVDDDTKPVVRSQNEENRAKVISVLLNPTPLVSDLLTIIFHRSLLITVCLSVCLYIMLLYTGHGWTHRTASTQSRLW